MSEMIVVAGPIAISVISYKNIKYILFGDKHFSQKGTPDAGEYFTADEIVRFIINETDDYKDIYIESPYTKDVDIALKILTDKSYDFMGGMVDKSVMLGNEKARYHYVDVRYSTSIYHKLIYPVLSRHVKKIDSMINRSQKIEDDVDIVVGKIFVDTLYGDKDIKKCLMWEYIVMCYESDNFFEDYNKWVEKILKISAEINIEDYTDIISKRYVQGSNWMRQRSEGMIKASVKNGILYHKKMLSHVTTGRYGVIVHKIRLQLIELERQGDKEMSKNIMNYCYDEMGKYKPECLQKIINHMLENWKDMMLEPNYSEPSDFMSKLEEFETPVTMECNLMDA